MQMAGSCLPYLVETVQKWIGPVGVDETDCVENISLIPVVVWLRPIVWLRPGLRPGICVVQVCVCVCISVWKSDCA